MNSSNKNIIISLKTNKNKQKIKVKIFTKIMKEYNQMIQTQLCLKNNLND